ncbi:GNAT family N-acetyltransferase [Aquimarina muelleri]|uniref:GNAT family N-acetyltransferase n=1 Tax=Aquimarina muelleri TaxID=279356 RepID=UPI003F682F2E
MQHLFYQTVVTYGSQLFTKSEIKNHSQLALDKSYWQEKFENDFIYNAKLNGEIVGSFSMDKKGNIEYLFVHMNYHGQGIASDLYSEIEKIARKTNIKMLTTQVNKITRSFFEKKGFKIIKNSVKVVGGEEIISYSGVKSIIY